MKELELSRRGFFGAVAAAVAGVADPAPLRDLAGEFWSRERVYSFVRKPENRIFTFPQPLLMLPGMRFVIDFQIDLSLRRPFVVSDLSHG